MLKIKHIYIILIFFIFSSNIISQFNKNYYYHPLSNSLVLTFAGGSNYPFTDYETPNLGWSTLGGLEYYFTTHSNNIIGIGIKGGLQNISSKENNLGLPTNFNTQIMNGSVEIIYSFAVKKNLFPFFAVGGSYNIYDFQSKNKKSKFFNYVNGKENNSIVINTESGLKYKISDRISIDFGLGYNYVLNDNIDAISVGQYKDFFISGRLGVSLTLLNKVDSDNDGIPDNIDMCPNEAEDMDGYQDEDGCPDYDNDNDGILDIIDGCQNSKEDFDGYKDEDGCPDIDNDNDGILDINDKCPNKAEDFDGYQDEDGCPEVDNDNDGILDINDKCPNKAEVFNGYQDEDGCPDEAPRQTYYEPKPKINIKNKIGKQKTKIRKFKNTSSQFTIHGESTFLGGSSRIKSSAFPKLNKIANQIKLSPNGMWSIEVHVDRSKTSSDALRISKNQAISIMNYFVSKGLSTSNFRTIGKGDSFPIASNSSVYGRMKNRRIIIKKIN